MSSAKQDKSISAQRSELLAYAKRRGYQIVGEYIDEAISGDDTERRAEFLRIREDAQAGKFDVVLCWDQDRFGRFDQLDAGYWIYPFRRAGARLETVAQGEIDWEDLSGQLIYSVNQMGKAQFLRDLARNTARGQLASAREGRAATGGPSPYGYRSRDGEVRIISAEAKVVRWIFREYLKPGGSLRGLAALLNKRKVPPPRGKIWRCSSVRAILQRREYVGSFVWGARNAGKYFAWRDGEVVPRRKADKTVASEPIVHPNRFEAIIDERTFDRAQAKLASRKGNTTARKARQYPLAGLLRCGDCGGLMGGYSPSTGPSYRCRAYHQSGSTVCYCNLIPEGPLLSVIARKIRERYLSETALARLRRKIEAKLAEKDRPPTHRELARLRREVEVLDRKIGNAEDAVLDAPPDLRPRLYRKLATLTTERDRLQAELEALTNREKRPVGQDGSEVDQAIEALRNLREALRRAKPEDSRKLLSSIVTKVELHFDHEPTEGGRCRNPFSYGTIYIRPDAGEGRGTEPDSDNAHLITNRPYSDTGVPERPPSVPIIGETTAS